MKKLVTWQPIRSAGNSRYDRLFELLMREKEITGVWGAAFEQSSAENIADRGTTFGFHYLRPDCYKVPNPKEGGIVSVPWVSTDVNLTFRLGWGSGFTFDPDDVLSIGAVRPGKLEYWKRLVDEYRKQTAWNEFVPLVIQQEYASVGDALRRNDKAPLEVLDGLFAYLREQRIRVVTMAEAVGLYRKAAGDSTLPAYALWNNLGREGLAARPELPAGGRRLQVTSNRITGARAGAAFNGFHAGDSAGGARLYYDPEGRLYQEQGRLFSYYDTLGLLMFEEGNPQPIRITPYNSLPASPHKPCVLPEMSDWYNTRPLIPRADLSVSNALGVVRIKARAMWQRNPVVGGDRLPYGLMLWGDYSAYRLPPRAPPGSRILGAQGVFLAFPLDLGENALELELKR